MERGTVARWFEERGFGFIRPETGDADVFLHIGTLRRCGIEAVRPGDVVEFVALHGERGLAAAEVRRAE